MQVFETDLYDKLKGALKKIITEEHHRFTQVRQCINACQDAITELKSYVLEKPFAGSTEEIHFFKEVQPRFYCQFIYYVKIFRIETNRPAGSDKVLLKYLREQLHKIKYFFYNNRDLYQYYRMGATYLDETYFIRGRYDIQLLPDDLALTIDPGFSTIQSYKLAKLQANELLRIYINGAISEIQGADEPASIYVNKKSPLQWTGSKVALIELSYALKDGGVFNKASADIKQIISCFEEVFNIELGNFYNVFQEMRMRKKNRTSFLDLLKERLVQHMDEADEGY